MAVTLSAHALTTVQAVKDYMLGKDVLPPVEHDDLLRRLINARSDAIEQYCGGRHFEKATYTNERYARTRGRYLQLLQYPVLSVSAVSIGGVAVAQGSQNNQYEVLSDQGQLYRADGWEADATRLPQEDRDILVSYTAGYVLPKDDSSVTPRTLPWDLEDACCELVVAAYKLRDKAGLATESFEGQAMTFAHWPAHVRATLDKYVRPRSR